MAKPDTKLIPPRARSAGRPATVSAMPNRAGIDRELMARITGQKDRAALEDLAVHYGPRLKAYLMSRGEHDQTAEDIVQDIIIQVWMKASKFDGSRGTFSAWVYRMTRNKWIDHKRKQKRLQPTSPDIIAHMSDDHVEAADVDFDRGEAADAVREHLARLPNQNKQMLHLAFFEGLTHTQIADRTGLPLGTVKGRIRASLKKMRPGLEDYRGVDE